MHSNEKLSLLKSEVLTVVLMNNEGKRNVASCWLVNSHCHVRGVQCLHIPGQAVFDEVLYSEDGGTTLLLKALNYLPVDVFQHTKTLIIFQCQSPSHPVLPMQEHQNKPYNFLSIMNFTSLCW